MSASVESAAAGPGKYVWGKGVTSLPAVAGVDYPLATGDEDAVAPVRFAVRVRVSGEKGPRSDLAAINKRFEECGVKFVYKSDKTVFVQLQDEAGLAKALELDGAEISGGQMMSVERDDTA